MDGLFVNDSIPYENGAVIKVVGVGGCGGNAVSNMISSNVSGSVEYVAVNTDSQALAGIQTTTSVLLGKTGLGAGGNPERGKMYALESLDDIRNSIKGADMVFITAGMGGGTGTGASPVVAAEAKSAGALTVAIVYTPAASLGRRRMDIADNGLKELIQYVDSYIVVSNDNLQDIDKKMTHKDALRIADDVLRQSIQGICEIASQKGHINIDFADITTAMSEKGKAVMGIGTAGGEDRAQEAFDAALKSPLLNDTNIKGAHALLINISGNEDDLLMSEVTMIQDLAYEEAGETVMMFDGVKYDDRTDGTISVTIVATGINADAQKGALPNNIVVPKPSSISTELQSRIKQTTSKDGNLPSFSDDEFEIPTYLRKQAD